MSSSQNNKKGFLAGIQSNLSSYFSKRKDRNSSPLLKDDDNEIEMSEDLHDQEANRQRREQDGFDKEREIFHDSEIDQIDITRGQKSRKKFLNRVFNKNKTGFLLNRVDVQGLTFKRKHWICWCLNFYSLMWILNAFIAFKLILSSTSSFSRGMGVKISVNESVSSMVSDLKAEPIMDIQLVQSSVACPDRYENILLGEWPGTSSACFCSSSNSLFRGDCQSNGRSLAECRDISKIDPVSFSTWNNMKWCAKRAQINQDYVKQSQCPIGYKNCYFGVCMKESFSCPITSVNPTESKGNSLTFLREINKPPLARVGVFLQNASCLKGANHLMSDNPSYILLNKGPSECNQYGLDGELTKYLGQEKVETLLKENKAPEEVYNLPLYNNILKESEASFYQRRRIEIDQKTECLDIDFESILSQFKETWRHERLKFHVWVDLSVMAFFIIFGWICLNYKEALPSWIFSGRYRGLQIAFVFVIYMFIQFRDYKAVNIYVKDDLFGCFSSSGLGHQIDELNDFFRLPSALFVFNLMFVGMSSLVIFKFVSLL